MSTMVDIAALGRRIRKLRLERRLTLKQVESSSGLSATHLSEIERGRTSPTIGALIRIARALEKDASYFIENEEREEVGRLAREDRRSSRPTPGVNVEVLSEGIPGSRIFAYRLLLDPARSAKVTLEPQSLPGEAFYLVRQGQLSVEFGDGALHLEPGDSAQATLTKLHRIQPLGDETAEVIAIFTDSLEKVS